MWLFTGHLCIDVFFLVHSRTHLEQFQTITAFPRQSTMHSLWWPSPDVTSLVPRPDFCMSTCCASHLIETYEDITSIDYHSTKHVFRPWFMKLCENDRWGLHSRFCEDCTIWFMQQHKKGFVVFILDGLQSQRATGILFKGLKFCLLTPISRGWVWSARNK